MVQRVQLSSVKLAGLMYVHAYISCFRNVNDAESSFEFIHHRYWTLQESLWAHREPLDRKEEKDNLISSLFLLSVFHPSEFIFQIQIILADVLGTRCTYVQLTERIVRHACEGKLLDRPSFLLARSVGRSVGWVGLITEDG